MPYEEHYDENFSVLPRNPNLNITFAYCMFLSKEPKRLTDMFDTFKNVAVDLTPGGEIFENMQTNLDLWREIFEKYLPLIKSEESKKFILEYANNKL